MLWHFGDVLDPAQTPRVMETKELNDNYHDGSAWYFDWLVTEACNGCIHAQYADNWYCELWPDYAGDSPAVTHTCCTAGSIWKLFSPRNVISPCLFLFTWFWYISLGSRPGCPLVANGWFLVSNVTLERVILCMQMHQLHGCVLGRFILDFFHFVSFTLLDYSILVWLIFNFINTYISSFKNLSFCCHEIIPNWETI